MKQSVCRGCCHWTLRLICVTEVFRKKGHNFETGLLTKPFAILTVATFETLSQDVVYKLFLVPILMVVIGFL